MVIGSDISDFVKKSTLNKKPATVVTKAKLRGEQDRIIKL